MALWLLLLLLFGGIEEGAEEAEEGAERFADEGTVQRFDH